MRISDWSSDVCSSDLLAALESAGSTQEKSVVIHAPETLDQIVARCRVQLTAYQNAAYAQQYRELVDQVLAAEKTVLPQGRPRLTIDRKVVVWGTSES